MRSRTFLAPPLCSSGGLFCQDCQHMMPAQASNNCGFNVLVLRRVLSCWWDSSLGFLCVSLCTFGSISTRRGPEKVL